MSFEKIKNYNQLLLSIAGTGLIIFFLVLGVIFLLDQFNRKRSRNDVRSGIIAQDETDSLLADSLRKQIVTFNSIKVIDSADQIFILPVTQATLKEEDLDNIVFGFANNFKSSGYGKYRRHGNGIFNNLVLFDAKINKSDIIFSNRISINNYDLYERSGKKFLIITGTDKDSNQDKYLNSDDLQELFIYELGSKKLTKIELEENYSTLSITHSTRTDFLFGKFGLDRNKDGKFDPRKEPILFKKINIQEATLTNVMEESQINRLQEMLEGR